MSQGSLTSPATNARIDQLTTYFQAHGAGSRTDAWHEAVVAIGNTIRTQANILAFSDTFFLLGVALGVALIASLLLKRPAHMEAGGGH